MPRNIDKIIERSKSRKNDETLQSTSSSRVDRVISESRYKSSTNPDTLYDDLNTIGTRTGELFGSWQTKETMDNYRPVVQGAYDRVMAHENYRLGAGADLGLPDLSGVAEGFNQLLSGWDDQTDLYGYYQNEDAFNTAVKNSQLVKQFEGLSYGDVQGLMRKYDKGSDEYEYLANYTQYSSVEDFDKALAGLYDGSKLLSEAKEYEGKISSYEGRAKTFEGRTRGLTNDGGFGKKADETRDEYDAWLNGMGYSSADEFKNAMETNNKKRASLEEQKKLWQPFEEFKGIEQNADFNEKGQYVKKDVKYEPAGYGSSYMIASDEDAHRYNLINGDKNAQDYESLYNVHQYGTNDDIMYEYLEPEEKQKYNYLWETQGPKKANQYADALAPFLRQRRVEHEAELDAQMARENPFATSVVSVFDNVGNNMMALPMLAADALDGDGIDENSSLYRGRRRVNTERSTVEGMIDSDIGKFFYRHGLNTADNLATMAVSGFGKYGAVSKVIQTGIMSSGAFVDTTLDAKSRGLSDEQALTIGAIAGAAEYYFESKGFESMFGGNNLSGGAMGYFVDNLKTELVGELGTELTNDFADFLVAQDMNKWKLSMEDYVKRGYSESEALSHTIKDYALKYADVAGGTLFSSGVMTAPSAIGVHSQNKAVGKDLRGAEQIGDVLNIASMTPEESEAYEAYTRYANKGVTADNITDAQLGSLYNTMSGEASEGFRTANNDLSRAKGIIDKQKAIRESETASEAKKARATSKLDTAIANQTDAQVRRVKYAETLDKLSGINKKIFDKAVEKAEAEEKAKHEAEVKKLSSGVETSVVSGTDKAIEIKGMKDAKTLITSDGEVALKDVQLSDRDAKLVVYASHMPTEDANLYLANYDGSADMEQYKNDFELISTMAGHKYSEDEMLKAKGVLSAEAVSNIYTAKVMNKAKEEQRKIDELNEAMGETMSYKAVIDDSVIDYDSKSVKGKVNWNSLNSRHRQAIVYAKGFAKAMGINLTLIADVKKKGINGSYNKATNTITLDVYAGINQNIGAYTDTIIPTMSHEVTHWMKDKAPEIYQKLGEKIFATLAMEGEGHSEFELIQKEKSEQASRGKRFTDEQARDEIIARACEDLLSMSEKGKEMFVSLSEIEQKTLIDKIKEIIGKVKNWIDGLLNTYSSDREEAKILQKYADDLSEILKMWEDMLVSSKKANASMEEAGVWDEYKKSHSIGDKGVQNDDRDDFSITNKITVGMSDAERYEILKNKKIQPQEIEIDKDFNIDFKYLEDNAKRIVEAPLLKKLEELNVFKKYQTVVVSDVDFEFTKTGFRKSINSQENDYGGNKADFAKVILNLQKLLDNSVLIETHTDKAKGTHKENLELKQVYVLISAYKENKFITPVQFEVKQYVNDDNRLYLAVALTKIETSVVGDAELENQVPTSLLPVSDISITDLFKNVNPIDKNFLKYIPNQFLDNEQIIAKNKAIELEKIKYFDTGGIQNSDRDDDISVYEKLGELDRVTKERDALIEDMNWLRQRLKLEGKVSDGKYFTDSSILNFAGKLLRDNDSEYDKVEFARRLRRLYYDMVTSKMNDDELWNNVMAIASDVRSMAKAKVVKNDYAIELLKEIKGTRVRFNNNQKAEAKAKFGANWNRNFFGKIILADDARMELDEQWKVWAKEYPDIFDAHVKDGNQVEELFDIIDTLKNQSRMVEEYNESEFATHIATQILGGTWDLKPIVTTADKYSEKIKDLKSKHKQTITELREGYESRVEKAKLAERMYYGRQMNEMRNEHKAKLAEERKKASAKVDEVRAELREDYNARLDERMLAERMHFGKEIAELRRTKKEQVAEAKELGRQKMAEYKENAQKKTKIQSITANVLDLNNKLEINSKDKHIPEAMKDAVGELIRAIDFSSKRLLEGGKPTKNDISIDKALGHLKDAITDGSKEIGDILDEMYGSGVDESLKDLVKSVDKHMSMIDGQVFTLNEMTLEELKELDSIIKVIKSTANKLNQFHVAHYNAGVQALGIRSVKEINSRKKIFKDDKKHFEKMKTHVYWNNLNPFYAFKNLGEAAQKIFTALQDGQDKLAFLAKEVIDFTKKVYSQKDYNQWKDKYFTFEVAQPNGKIEKFSMNVPQIMSLYCVSKQEDARMHILHGDENEEGGGITIT